MLVQQTATALRQLLRSGEVTAAEVLARHLEQIERFDPEVNAICTLVADAAHQRAAELDQLARDRQGPLHGLPIAIKDLEPTAGIRTTFGSPIFGATRNPWNLERTPGGSSGGAAAALAARMLPIADGSDFGGSLRNPASFCNVVGLRPSVGRIPVWPAESLQPALSVLGPMARTVDDVALLLSVQAGPDPRAPLTHCEAGAALATVEPLSQRERHELRIAWTPDLGGEVVVESRVLEVCASALDVFRDFGATVEERCPSVAEAMSAFQVLRAAAFATRFESELAKNRHLMKHTVIWNIEQGLHLSALDLARAESIRARVFHGFRRLLERFDVLALPVSQVTPFPVGTEWIREIEGTQMTTYIDWMASCCIVSLTGLPAISMPAGFTDDGLPIGIQLVGRPNGESQLLRVAKAFEHDTRFADRLPRLLTDG